MTNTQRNLLALSFALVSACGGSQQRAETPRPVDRTADELGLPGPREEVVAEPDAPPAPPPVRIVAGESTPIEGPIPTLRVTAPRANQTIRTGAVQVRLALANWALEAPQGPHVHLILDNEPYIAIRDASRPIDVGAVVQENLHHELSEGTHVLRFFPSRAQHESVKDPGAFATVVFNYRRPTEGFSFDATAPLLTFSRPKGCNPAGERLLLDFFVTNATLGADQHRVRATLDGVSSDIVTWAPHWIENLPVGDHEIRLELLGPDGAAVPGPFNDTTRTFTIAAECPAPAAGAPADPHAGH